MKQFPAVPVSLPVMKADGTIGEPVTRNLVFSRPEGGAHTRTSVNWHWDKARAAAGIPSVSQASGQHALRHTAATTWLSNGLSLAKVVAYLGDTQEVVLSTYSHVLPDDDDRARDIMNGCFAPPAEGGAQNVPSAEAEGV